MASTRAKFDTQLQQLKEQLLQLGMLVDEALEKAIRALVERDAALAIEVVERDRVINELRYQVEEQSYLLLATQQPMATDLRRIASAISIATNLERMGDHAAGIAILAHHLSRDEEMPPVKELETMAELARAMFHRALEAFTTGDPVLAREVADEDQALNSFYEQVVGQLLNYMIAGPRMIRRGTYLLWVAHNLERWGDRIQNICERVVYVVTGELTDFDVHAGPDDELDEHGPFGDDGPDYSET
jgi:phosphate transport system protein